MNVTPIRNPLDGEQIVAVDPPLAPRVDAGWRRRLHLFTGRSLDASALTAEQRARAARAALLARAFTPGIVTGLEVSLEGTELEKIFLDVAPGLGITAYGEDVRLSRSLRVKLDQLHVIAADGGGDGSILKDLINKPSALVLVLQPVLVEEIGETDPLDPCERDPQSEAFEDQRTVDGCRPVLFNWPTDWVLPKTSSPDDKLLWRNRLAWDVFEKALLTPGPLPWEEVGLPLALIGWDTALKTRFFDRSIVARIGGRPRPRTALLPGVGDPALWQARIQQFVEHLAELLAAPNATVASAASHFELLPPAGLLPRQAVEFNQAGGDDLFFPSWFQVGAAPIPLDELEPIFEASAPLARLDLRPEVPEEVQILVPVPGALYDPDLLVQEPEPTFEPTLGNFRTDRNQWLGRRKDLRDKAKALMQSLGGAATKLPFPENIAEDPDAQASETAVSPVPTEDPYGTVGNLFQRTVTAFTDLKDQFVKAAGRFKPIAKEWNPPDLTKDGLEGLAQRLEEKIKKANDKIDLGFLHLQTEIYRVRQIVLGNVAGTRLATSPVLTEVARGVSARATRRDLEQIFKVGQQASGVEGTPPQVEKTFFDADPAATAELQIVSPILAQSAAAKMAKAKASGDLAKAGHVFEAAFESAPTPEDVKEQTHLPGVMTDFRGLSIAERLAVPPAAQALDSAWAQQLRLLFDLAALGLAIDDLPVPLVQTTKEGNITHITRVDVPFRDVMKNPVERVMQQPRTRTTDEADVLGDAILLQENISLLLRRLESRIHLYQAALEACRDAIETIQGHIAAALQRLAELDRKLAEARHDVAVSEALLLEEQQRINAINSRRLEILNNHVPFLAYHRPRVVETLADTPVRYLDPAPSVDPVPTALASSVEPPAELREMVDLLRDAPLRWFRRLLPLLDRIDRLDLLRDMLRRARERAEAALARTLPPAPQALGPASPAAKGLLQMVAIQRQTMTQQRSVTAQLDLALAEKQSWKGAVALARNVLSLGDLLDLPHGHADVARLAAREIDEILRVATALWAGFAAVLPALRLGWIARLSQFDAPFDLRRLSNQPGWEKIPDVLDRRALQLLVDWLFQRIDTREAEAVARINDLVRVCVLLASHAPVNRLVAGHVAEGNLSVRPGMTVSLVADLARVRIGMHVLLFSAGKIVARGIVEDLGGGRAIARVLHIFADKVSIDKDARVEFTEAILK